MSTMPTISASPDDRENCRTALILYGSETGNAHDIANDLGRMAERLRFSTYVTSLDSVDPSYLKSFSIVLISVSTTGQGDLPNNATHFWKNILRKKLPFDYLKGVEYTTFGLGDSSYPKYNWAARKLHKRLLQLGATQLYDKGEADEQHPEGSDASYLPWSSNLRLHLLRAFPLSNGLEPIPEDVLLEPRMTLQLSINSSKSVTFFGIHGETEVQKLDHSQLDLNNISTLSTHSGTPLNLKLNENRRMTPESHWQDVRKLVFTTEDHINYIPGDILTLYPQNPDGDVNQMMECMGWTELADREILCKISKPIIDFGAPSPFSDVSFSQPTTLRRLLTNSLDFNAIPRRSFFSTIAHFTSDTFQRTRLLEFTNSEYLDELYDYTTRPRRSILEVLQEFDTVKIPWQWATSVLPELRGRQFSIASGGQLKSDGHGSTRFEVLVAIVKYKTVIKKIREGTCSRYLAKLPAGTSLYVTLGRGGLGVYNSGFKQPIIMVGPGTGVAPIRSLIWERLAVKQSTMLIDDNGEIASNGPSLIGESVLFFGGRNRHADYFFEKEWQALQERMPLRVFTAFSRDQPRKTYVQDTIKEQSALVHRLLYDMRGILYICGSSGKMPQAVREALIEVFQAGACIERSSAEAYLLGMEKEGRYKQETW